MKRFLAMLLTGCMLVQPLPGAAVAALGAEEDSVITLSDGGGIAADAEAGDMFAAETGSDVDLGIVEEISPDDTLTVPETPEGNNGVLQVPGSNADGSVTTDEESSDILFGDEIIDDIGIVTSVGEDGFEEETEEIFEDGQETEAESESEGELLEWELIETSEAEAIADPAAEETASKSYLEVKVASGLPFYPAGGLKVTVGIYKKDNDDFWMLKDIILTKPEDENGKSEGVADFEVEPGEYRVSVDAPKFARYVQDVTVNSYERAKISISTAKTINELSTAVTGWLRLGDVTNGYTIEQEDIDAILAAMRSEETTYDANLNEGLEDPEEVDLADLQIAVQSLYGEEQLSTVGVDKLPVNAEPDSNTTVKGNLADLFNGVSADGKEKVVTLNPANGGEITEENPVAVSFDLVPEGTPEAELPKLEGMTIKAPVTDEEGNTTTGISGGQVEVTVIENGTEKILLVPMREGSQIVAASMPVSAAVLSAAPRAESAMLSSEPEISMPEPVMSGEPEVFTGEAEPVVLIEPEMAMSAVEKAPVEDYGDGDIVVLSDEMEELAVQDGTAVSEEKAVPEVQTEAPVQAQAAALPTETVTGSKATVSSDGSIVLDFGRQVAVKKVTIKITGTTKKESNLVDIVKVEFVNNMEGRIPEPELNI